MPQDWKTSINNLVVVWQGSSWSVIAPDGHVIFRHWDKRFAYEWASQCFDYASSEFEPYDLDLGAYESPLIDADAVIVYDEKPKRQPATNGNGKQTYKPQSSWLSAASGK